MENIKPDEALELSNQELDSVAGGATSDVFGRTINAETDQLGFVIIPKEGGIISVTSQQVFFSEQELNEFKAADVS
jgi:hypothetical protein